MGTASWRGEESSWSPTPCQKPSTHPYWGGEGSAATFPQHLPAPQSSESLNDHRKRREKPVSSVLYCSPLSASNFLAPPEARSKGAARGALPCQDETAGTILPLFKLLAINDGRARVTLSVLHNLDLCPQDNSQAREPGIFLDTVSRMGIR